MLYASDPEIVSAIRLGDEVAFEQTFRKYYERLCNYACSLLKDEEESEEVVQKVARQIEKQVEVLKVFYNTDDEIVWQEMAMYKVPTKVIAEQVKVERLLRQYGANTVVIRNDYTVFETTGHKEEIDALAEALQPWGLIEFVRGARIAIIKASEGLHQALLEFEAAEPSEPVVENEFLDKRDGVFTL